MQITISSSIEKQIQLRHAENIHLIAAKRRSDSLQLSSLFARVKAKKRSLIVTYIFK